MIDQIAESAVLRWVMLLALFGVVAVVGYVLATSVTVRQATRRRLLDTPQGPTEAVASSSLRAEHNEGAWVKLVNAIEQTGLSLVDTRDDSLRRKLISAGYTAPHAPRVFTLIRLGLVIGLPALMVLLYAATGSAPGLGKIYITVIVAALIGLYLPNLYIRVRTDRRQREIINGFPDALDLMLVCVEAGLGLDAAFARVGMEVTESHPRLAEQLGAVVLELRAGRSREDALRRMADRAGVDEIRAFATLLIQSTKLGSSVAQTLRIYAAEMRERRRMRAEEKAHRLPVLLSIPLVGCMLPVMIGVLMLPAAIRIVRAVVPSLEGG